MTNYLSYITAESYFYHAPTDIFRLQYMLTEHVQRISNLDYLVPKFPQSIWKKQTFLNPSFLSGAWQLFSDDVANKSFRLLHTVDAFRRLVAVLPRPDLLRPRFLVKQRFPIQSYDMETGCFPSMLSH